MIEQRVNLIIDYIEQIMFDNDIVYGDMGTHTIEIDDVKYKSLDIVLKNKPFSRHFNLNIQLSNEATFYKKLLDTFIEKFALSENIGISKYDYRRAEFSGPSFYGIQITNLNGSHLEFYICPSNEESELVIEEYNQKLDDLMHNCDPKYKK